RLFLGRPGRRDRGDLLERLQPLVPPLLGQLSPRPPAARPAPRALGPWRGSFFTSAWVLRAGHGSADAPRPRAGLSGAIPKSPFAGSRNRGSFPTTPSASAVGSTGALRSGRSSQYQRLPANRNVLGAVFGPTLTPPVTQASDRNTTTLCSNTPLQHGTN